MSTRDWICCFAISFRFLDHVPGSWGQLPNPRPYFDPIQHRIIDFSEERLRDFLAGLNLGPIPAPRLRDAISVADLTQTDIRYAEVRRQIFHGPRPDQIVEFAARKYL
jgi:hypothetical protein